MNRVISPDIDAYIRALGDGKTVASDERRSAFLKLFDTINQSADPGLELRMQYGMPSWCVPLNAYPAGYHVTPDTPLPFISLGNQRRHIGLYHMGIYANPQLLAWFQGEWPQHSPLKLDMGKSCIRFKSMKTIPLALVGELCERMNMQAWIDCYETTRTRD